MEYRNLTHRQLFLNHVGQTSPAPLGIEGVRAKGVRIYQPDGSDCIDLISGISVSNIGHCHPKVVEAVKEQAETYMHLMVYGEVIQSPQVKLAMKLNELIPDPISSFYFVNSGSEANEAALKLAKRYTGREELISCVNAYHGSSHGPLSMMGSELYKRAYRPLLPGVQHICFNEIDDLKAITDKTAAILIEPVQGEGGIRLPKPEYMKALRQRCDETGCLLIFDEVQTAFGRLGKWFGFEVAGIMPDIITFAKGLGGGMPIGALGAPKEMMDVFTDNPILGHITTFGGHPVSCAAALATLEVLQDSPELIADAQRKGELFRSLLKHELIKEIRGEGLFMAIETESFDVMNTIVRKAALNGIMTDPFLFCEEAFRLSPPLVITDDEIKEACERLLIVLDMVRDEMG